MQVLVEGPVRCGRLRSLDEVCEVWMSVDVIGWVDVCLPEMIVVGFRFDYLNENLCELSVDGLRLCGF